MVLASDFSPRFLNFVPIASHFWRREFAITPDLALVYPSRAAEQVRKTIPWLEPYVTLHLFESHPVAPIGNQAKLARWFLASHLDSELTTIDDLDTVHTQSAYLNLKFGEMERGKMLAIGREVYEGTNHEGAFPMGNFSGSGTNFSSLFGGNNFDDKGFHDFVESFRGHRLFSRREDPFLKDFSDEYLLRAIRQEMDFDENITFVRRDLDVRQVWLDRSWWHSYSQIESGSADYETINFPRPLWENRRRIFHALQLLAPELRRFYFPIPMSMNEWRLRILLRTILKS